LDSFKKIKEVALLFGLPFFHGKIWVFILTKKQKEFGAFSFSQTHLATLLIILF
jgi:hypothetical protein